MRSIITLMNYIKITAVVCIILALAFGIYSFLKIEFPIGIEAYFTKDYYRQFAYFAACAELLIAENFILIDLENSFLHQPYLDVLFY
jgi:hypothetical protein